MTRKDKILQTLTLHNLHVHAIDGESLPVPFAVQQASTHYIMQNNDVVFVGKLNALEGFVLSLSGVTVHTPLQPTAFCRALTGAR